MLVQASKISGLYTPNYNCLVILNEDQNVRRNSGEWDTFEEAKGQEWLFVLLNQRGDHNGILQSQSLNSNYGPDILFYHFSFLNVCLCI